LAVALAEACISGELGAEIRLEMLNSQASMRWDEILFGEAASRILVSVKPQQQESWESHLSEQLGSNWLKMGLVRNQDGKLRMMAADGVSLIEVKIKEAGDRSHQAIEKRLTVQF
jgi:phosphoribosylformylglycinamidine synthase